MMGLSKKKKRRTPLKQYPALSLDHPARYQIKVQGRVEADWSDYLSELTLQHLRQANGGTITVLSGTVCDQASLHGLLNHIRDLGLPLLLVEFVKTMSEAKQP
jgi:hypothetical protein